MREGRIRTKLRPAAAAHTHLLMGTGDSHGQLSAAHALPQLVEPFLVGELGDLVGQVHESNFFGHLDAAAALGNDSAIEKFELGRIPTEASERPRILSTNPKKATDRPPSFKNLRRDSIASLLLDDLYPDRHKLEDVCHPEKPLSTQTSNPGSTSISVKEGGSVVVHPRTAPPPFYFERYHMIRDATANPQRLRKVLRINVRGRLFYERATAGHFRWPRAREAKTPAKQRPEKNQKPTRSAWRKALWLSGVI